MAAAGSGGAGGRKRRPKTASGRRRAENRRLRKLLELEQAYWDRGLTLIAGVDEVGRGPLAGPVLAAAVVLPPGVAIRGVDDSKKLTAEKRAVLFEEIRAQAVSIGVAGASTREVDRINILRASHLAMKRALARLQCTPEHVFVDGLAVAELGPHHTAVVDGDAKVHCIACASIVAKVVRDRIMHLLATRYPGYGWDTNAGYATAEHRDAIIELGLTPHHRRSFESNHQLTLELL
ncbi:MAG TPA: ribonuclease HII [Longimicrobiales bacterium]